MPTEARNYMILTPVFRVEGIRRLMYQILIFSPRGHDGQRRGLHGGDAGHCSHGIGRVAVSIVDADLPREIIGRWHCE